MLCLIQRLFIAAFLVSGLYGMLGEPTLTQRQAALDMVRDHPAGLLPYLQGLRQAGLDVSSLLLDNECAKPVLAELLTKDLIQGCLEMLESLPSPPNPVVSLWYQSGEVLLRLLQAGAVPYIGLELNVPLALHATLEPFQIRLQQANRELMTLRQVLRGLRSGQPADPNESFYPELLDPLMCYLNLDEAGIEERLTDAPQHDPRVLKYYRQTI